MWLQLRQQVRSWQIVLVTAPSVAGLVIALSLTGVFQLLELAAFDRFFRYRPQEAPDQRIVIVSINESDIRENKEWPISDALLAQLLKKIKSQQPRVIGLNLYRNFPIEPGHQELVRLFESTPNLIGSEKVLGERIPPSPTLAKLNQVSITDFVSDEDRKIRRALLSVSSDDRLQFSLGTQLALNYLEVDNITLEQIPNTKSHYRLGKAIFKPFQSNDGGYVGADERGYQVLLNYRGGSCQNEKQSCPFKIVSMSEVLQKQIPSDLMRDRIVLVGVRASSVTDTFFTPYSWKDATALTGVEIHAHVTSMIVSAALDGRPLIETFSDYLEYLWILLWSGLGAITGVRVGQKKLNILVVLFIIFFFLSLLIICLILSCYVLFSLSFWIPIFTPFLALTISIITSVTYVLGDKLKKSYQELEENAQTLEQKVKVIRLSPHPITITLRKNGKHLEVNQSFLNMIGYSEEEVIDHTAVDLNLWVNPEDRKYLFEELTTNGNIQNYEFDFRTKQSEIRTALLSAEVIELRGEECLLSISNDITDRKKVEAELEKAKEAADTANKAKSTFLANMSHELRTPLNAILGFTQLMYRFPKLSSDQKEYLDIIGRSGEHLLSLINEVLDLSKIEAGRMTLYENSFDLYKLLNTIEEMLKLKANSQGLQLIINPAAGLVQYIKTDERKLRQVLINLIGNGIKFTKQGSISVTVRSQPLAVKQDKYSHALYFEIEDTGSGIAPEDLEKLFEAFTQTEVGQQAQEGTGLGLPISRKFIQLMGGNITVSSVLGEGTTFKFDIKVSLAQADDILTPASERRVISLAENQPIYRILVVDDQSENRQLLLKLLTPLGFKLREAVNGSDAVNHWESWQPDLILMDMRMPVMNGSKATQHIREQEEQLQRKGSKKRVVIIGLTASTLKEEQEALLAVGCDEILYKPFQENVLLERIATNLGIRYLYEESADTMVTSPVNVDSLTPENLEVMPPDWIKQLHQAASAGDDEQLDNLIQEIPENYPSLRKGLNNLIVRYDFRKIRKLTNIDPPIAE
ncbi:MAG: CHASE2 domain-containing protein [Cyanobacteriota bacterium]|nr:CHASE2 domain-containing protein [Cyanobacteriota bacterium]